MILPGYMCVMDVDPIRRLGATPVCVNIEPATYNIDVSLLKEKATPRTKVIVAQHTYGYPYEMDAILEITHKRGGWSLRTAVWPWTRHARESFAGRSALAAYWSFQWNPLCREDKVDI